MQTIMGKATTAMAKMKDTSKRALCALMAVMLAVAVVGLSPFMLPTRAYAAETEVVITQSMTVAEIQSAIQDAIDAAGSMDWVIVTGSKTDADASLTLNIPSAVDVAWEADYSGTMPSTSALITLTGNGWFSIYGVTLKNNSTAGHTIYCPSPNNVEIELTNGATVEGGYDAIRAENSRVRVFDGSTVKTTTSGGRAIWARVVYIGSDSIIQSDNGTAIRVSVAGSTVEIEGGTISAGVCAVDASGSGDAVVTITGGTLTAPQILSDVYIAAVLAGAYSGTLTAGTCDLVVEVDPLVILPSWDGTSTGIAIKAGIGTAVWDTESDPWVPLLILTPDSNPPVTVKWGIRLENHISAIISRVAIEVQFTYPAETLFGLLEELYDDGCPNVANPGKDPADFGDVINGVILGDPELLALFTAATPFLNSDVTALTALYGSEAALMEATENGDFASDAFEAFMALYAAMDDLLYEGIDEFFTPEAIGYAKASFDYYLLYYMLMLKVAAGDLTEEEVQAITAEFLEEITKVSGLYEAMDNIDDLLGAGEFEEATALIEEVLSILIDVLIKNGILVPPTIEGHTAMILTEGSSGLTIYVVGGTEPVTVTQDTTHGGAIIWNAETRQLEIAGTLSPGDYTVVLTASNGIEPDATLTFVLTVKPKPVAPTIDGNTAMTLTEGYAATSTNAYEVTGTEPVTVTQDTTHGDKIVWNAETQKLEIAAGLAAGSYVVALTASNDVEPDAAITFTLTVEAVVDVVDPGLPQTGDNAPVPLLLVLSVLALLTLGAGVVLVATRRGRNGRKDAA